MTPLVYTKKSVWYIPNFNNRTWKIQIYILLPLLSEGEEWRQRAQARGSTPPKLNDFLRKFFNRMN
ncbi:hypothetical protein EZS27_011288 [termite gut metagenome]|uniref:Uncharacterized protein n=1 Tax=termite gut metagenome TaxID=433724 RepID=A0A5J4S3U1_9ZZZZ